MKLFLTSVLLGRCEIGELQVAMCDEARWAEASCLSRVSEQRRQHHSR